MPPFAKDGNSPLWEAIGRRFMNMGYHDADLLSRSNKEFILSLFPSDNIYQTLLPIEARNAIGKVGKDTEPVRKMLESIGFKYIFEVDPFDGGPHYRCPLKDIHPIKNMIKGKIKYNDFNPTKAKEMLIYIPQSEFDFYALKTEVYYSPAGELHIQKEIQDQCSVNWGEMSFAIPF
jgi:arginine N-succinyltransferase